MESAPQRLKPRKRLKYENHLALIALVTAAPAIILAVTLTWLNASQSTSWAVTVCLFLFVCAGVAALRHRARFPLQTLGNLVAAIREGDFSTRARTRGSVDALGELAGEINALAAHLRGQRFDSVEAAALLRTVMAEIDVAVFAFDPQQRLALINRAGEKIMGRAAEQLLSRSAAELGLGECLEGEASRLITRAFPGGGERWSVRRGKFRQAGAENQLVVLTDLSRALREEERQAWQRLLRVLGHELNNSLAPIKSIAASLEELIGRESKPIDWQDDLRSGLSVISSRTAALTRFMQAYSTLAKLPPPQLRTIVLPEMLRRLATLERRLSVQLEDGPEVSVKADPDQLEQLIINLLRNAVDAVLEGKATPEAVSAGIVTLRWALKNGYIEIAVEDNGPGIANMANLFVPFFTTKPGGSGIGLVLSRQIAEAHGGSLAVENRQNNTGCVARLRLRGDKA